jgi:hypothetical protein
MGSVDCFWADTAMTLASRISGHPRLC